MSKLATIITTYKRPHYLQRALNSALEFFGNSHEIIVSAAGYTGEEVSICKDVAKLVSYTNDPGGCNSLWLRGLYQTDAEYVHILHDDDFYNVTEKDNFSIALSCIDKGIVPLWDGETHIEGTGDTHRIKHLQSEYGLVNSVSVSQFLQNRGGLTISPVCTLLHRETAIHTLKRASSLLKDCCSRKGMMIGNDLWLHLASYQKSSEVMYFENMFTCFGHHAGSETASEGGRLIKYYDVAREIWKNGEVKTEPNIVHLVHGDMYELAQMAKDSNVCKYDKETVRYESLPAVIVPTQLHTPLVNDLIDDACRKALDSDIIVYTNADIILCDNFSLELAKEFKTCAWVHRINISSRLNLYPRRQNYEHYPGADLFAFTKTWWLENKHTIPRLLIGYEAWDTVFMHRMKATGGKEIKGLAYHVRHQSHWEQPQNRHADSGQKFNRLAAKDYLIKAGSYKGQYDEGVIECELLAALTAPKSHPVRPLVPISRYSPLVDVDKIQKDGLFFRKVNTPSRLHPIILALQYYSGDQYEAEKLMRLIADIEPVRNSEDLFLIVYRFDSPPPNPATINHLKTKFANIVIRRGARNVKGHPGGCNAVWHDTMVNVSELGRTRRMDYVFTFEADCVPLKQDWIRHLKVVCSEAKRDNIRVTGHLLPECPTAIEHVNGNAIFSTKLLSEFPMLLNCPANDPWDLWSAKYFKRQWRHDSFIFNAYRQKGYTEEQFVALQKNGHALVHGIRDDNGLDFVRKIIG